MPLVPNSFPNGTHLCTLSTCHCLRCSSPTAFARHLVGHAHMEAPSGNTVNDIHDYSEAKQLGSKWRSLKTRTPLEWSMNLIKPKTLRGLCPHSTPARNCPILYFSGGMQQIMTKSLSVCPKARTEHTYSVLIRIPASTS